MERCDHVVVRGSRQRGFAALAGMAVLLSWAGGAHGSVPGTPPAPGQPPVEEPAAAVTAEEAREAVPVAGSVAEPSTAVQEAVPVAGSVAEAASVEEASAPAAEAREAPPVAEPAAVAAAAEAPAVEGESGERSVPVGEVAEAADPGEPVEPAAQPYLEARYKADVASISAFRPAHSFWQHVFTIPDGRIVFGSMVDGRLLAAFPVRGNWAREGVWYDPAFANVLDSVRLPSQSDRRRDRVSELLEPLVGRVVSNPTRGDFVAPHAERYGRFLEQWGVIYERFGVPAEIGLAQALLESGLNGRARSSADALGLCQWLRRNWRHLDRLDPNVIEVYNQTTQAPYCAAHLTILATMYDSFIPALSEHHAGGVNVGRTVINGGRLGGESTREQYFLGSKYAVDLRAVSIRRYRDLFRTYGRRSFLYSEMVFGNAVNVTRLVGNTPQVPIFAMRTPRALSMAEVRDKTGLSTDEVKRFNPALVRRVPRGAGVYLPSYVAEFGPDVSFWHRPPSPEFVAVLDAFVRLEPGVERWHDPAFETTLRDFQYRFRETETEEGTVMATTLAYFIDALYTSRRAGILAEFRTSGRIERLFRRGLEALGSGN